MRIARQARLRTLSMLLTLAGVWVKVAVIIV
jgi:hypothetical protein